MNRTERGYRISGYEWELLEERGFLAGLTTRGWYEHFLASNDTNYLERLLGFYTPPTDDVRILAHYGRADFLHGRVELPTDIRLLTAIAKQPELLLSLSWRDFELFTAEMLQKLGYADVRVGSGQKDGGVDVTAALEHPLGVERLIVQCKRFDPARKIGTPHIVQLLGSVDAHSASRGLIVTTSSLTTPAELIVEAKKHRINALDQTRLLAILRTLEPE